MRRSARVWDVAALDRRVEHTLRAHGEEERLGVGPRLFQTLNCSALPPLWCVNRKAESLCQPTNVLGYHRLRHTQARLDLFVIRSRRTRLLQNNLQSSRGTARLHHMLRMRAVVKKPRWPHLRFFRPPQGCQSTTQGCA